MLFKILAILFTMSLSSCLTENRDNFEYKVIDGNNVDSRTYQGWKTWRAMACERCHGQDQEGAVGPSLVESLKTMQFNEFHQILIYGKVDRGMPSFKESSRINKNIRELYMYLKGRSDGKIKSGRLNEIK